MRDQADIDLQKRQDDLEEALFQLEIAQRIGAIGRWKVNYPSGRIEWSDQALSIFGVEREALGDSLENFVEMVHPEDRGWMLQKRRRWLNKGGDFEAEYRIIRPDGTLRWIEVRARIHYQSDNSLDYTYGVLRDLTDQRCKEAEARQFRDLVEGSEDLCCILDDRYQYQWCNQAYLERHQRIKDDLRGVSIREIVGDERFSNDIKHRMDRCLGGETQRFETVLNYSDLGSRTLFVRYYPIAVATDERLRIGAVITDITEFRAAEAALRDLNEQLNSSLHMSRALIDSLPAHIAVLNDEGDIVDVNDQWRDYGREHRNPDPNFGIGMNYLTVCHETAGEAKHYADIIAAGLREVLAGDRENFTQEYPCHSPDGDAWFRATFTRLNSRGTGKGGAVAMHVDVSARKRAEQRLEKIAYVDPMTELYSRNGFVRQLATMLDAVEQPDGLIAMLDIKGQRDINEAHGYDIGDQLIIELSTRLASQAGKGGLAGRAGGDEFFVYLASGQGDSAEAVLRAFKDRLEEPYLLSGARIEIEVRIGYTELGAKPRTADELVREAELARFQNHEEASNQSDWTGYSEVLGERNWKRIEMTRELRHAIAADELELHFQPKVDIASGRMLSAEALVRWRHPERGLQPPALFIPIAEKSQLIGPIGDWVLRAACRQLRDWCDAGLDIVRISVNVSVYQLRKGGFAVKVRQALQDFDLSPAALALEITESVFARHSGSLQAEIRELHGMGVRLSLDDFGTGYSSLQYLQDYPFDEVKIDRAFVSRVLTDEFSRSVVQSVVKMATALNAIVVAEGIESRETAEALRDIGCTTAQGFFYSMPLESEDFRWLLEKRTALPFRQDLAMENQASSH